MVQLFSSTTTFFAPKRAAVSAATVPDPPAPTMTTSASMSSTAVDGAGFSYDPPSFFPPACFTQSVAAAMMAMLVSVAPVTASTSRAWCSTMLAGTRSMAASEMNFVSSWSVTLRLTSASSLNVASTCTGPNFPWLLAVYVPGLKLPAPLLFDGEHPVMPKTAIDTPATVIVLTNERRESSGRCARVMAILPSCCRFLSFSRCQRGCRPPWRTVPKVRCGCPRRNRFSG